MVITLPDSIAWLLNIRGSDVPHTPLALSNAIIHANGDVDWFIAAAKIPAEVKAKLGNHVQVKDPSTLEESLKALAGKRCSSTRNAHPSGSGRCWTGVGRRWSSAMIRA